MRYVAMFLTAFTAVAVNAQEVEEPTTGGNSEVVVADETSSEEDSAN